MTWKKKL